MAKITGMGANFYLGGNDLSGDINSLSKISGSVAPLDVTDITQSAHSRLGGERDGAIDFVSYFDPATAHPVLSALPTADVHTAFFVPALAVGSPVACMVAKQVNYDPTRPTDGSMTFAVSAQANAFGLEWGVALTAGKRTDTAATAGSPFDNGAGFTFGAQGYLQVFSFAGTDATVKIQHCTTSGGTYSDLITFSQVTSNTPTAQRVATSNTTTVNEFLKATTVTTGGFSSLVFAVMVNVNPVAGVSF